ncbi:MAG: cation diffusion facilitator family transporter [Planctomycetota bacterium]
MDNNHNHNHSDNHSHDNHSHHENQHNHSDESTVGTPENECSIGMHTHCPKDVSHKHSPDHDDENHDHHHISHRAVSARRLRAVVLLTGTMMIVELVTGYLTRSISLTSDGVHMLTHFSALLISFIAMKIAERGTCQRKSFGLYRVEILAAVANGLFLTGTGIVVVYEALERFVNPEIVRVPEMLVVAVVGLIVNVVSMFLLVPHSHGSLNIRSAALHMIGDTFSSVGVVIAGLIMLKWQWYILDPVVGIAIGAIILVWSVSLIRESIGILLEFTPKNIDVNQVSTAINEIEGVIGIHDIHIWEITTKMYAMCAHVKVGDIRLSESEPILGKICDVLDHKFDITHTSIQLEC